MYSSLILVLVLNTCFNNSNIKLIGFGNTGTSNVFGGHNNIFGKTQQTAPAFGSTQQPTQSFGISNQPSIFGSTTAQTSKPFGGTLLINLNLVGPFLLFMILMKSKHLTKLNTLIIFFYQVFVFVRCLKCLKDITNSL